MSEFRPGIVIPTVEGREENLFLVLSHIHAMTDPDWTLTDIQVIYDGPAQPSVLAKLDDMAFVNTYATSRRHEPGMEQPRNIGVRRLDSRCNAVWFLDSDILVEPDALSVLRERWEASEIERVIVCPYDWMPAGQRTIDPACRNDGRWPMFDEIRWTVLASYSVEELNVGLGCYGGNLVWPIQEFMRVGGFWNELHHGRCEDGELGLRAVAEGVPITLERRARGYHLDHPVNMEEKIRRNERDVPLLNLRHPWVQGQGVFMVAKDGKRFDQACDRCGEVVNTGAYWAHRADCLAHLHELELDSLTR